MEDIITIIMVVGDLVWEWVVVMGIMDIMGVWVDLGLVGIMEVGLVGIMVVDIMEGVGDLFLLTEVMVCVFCCGFWDVADDGRLGIYMPVWVL